MTTQPTCPTCKKSLTYYATQSWACDNRRCDEYAIAVRGPDPMPAPTPAGAATELLYVKGYQSMPIGTTWEALLATRDAELSHLRAENERLRSTGAEALLVASAVFTVWGDKFKPGTVEDFRAKERAFLDAADRKESP